MSTYPATTAAFPLRLDVVRAAGLAAAGGAWLHASAAWSHGATAPAEAVFFAAVAVYQLGWSAAVLRRPSRAVALAGLANAPVVALWALSRTAGLPVGAHAGAPLAVGWSDGLAALLGLAMTAGAITILRAARTSAPAVRRPLVLVLALLLPAYLALGLSAVQSDAFHDHGVATAGTPAQDAAADHDH